MKKVFCALALLAALAAGASAAEEKIDGVWGMKFGTARDVAGKIMTEKNKAQTLCEYTYQPGYSEAFYRVNFFGREGHLLLRFSKKGLFLARFAFVRRDLGRNPPPPPPQPEGPKVMDARAPGAQPKKVEEKAAQFSSNFLQLRSMLTKKYGSPAQEFKVGDTVCGYEWNTGTFHAQSVMLYEDRFIPGSPAVLTYEDTNRR